MRHSSRYSILPSRLSSTHTVRTYANYEVLCMYVSQGRYSMYRTLYANDTYAYFFLSMTQSSYICGMSDFILRTDDKD
jgi:hypothetical protein